MKPKRSTLPRAEPQDLTLESVASDDRTLPKPRGARMALRAENPIEAISLQRTRDFGGLLPDRIGDQYWQCPRCQFISRDREIVVECCHLVPNRIQVCGICVREHNRLFRIGDGCMCPAKVSK
jgi:hypothetical protein